MGYKSSSSFSFRSLFIGILFGGITTLGLFLMLPEISFESKTSNAAANQSNEESLQDCVQPVSTIDFYTNMTEAVEKASDAVVGVSNIQMQSFWYETEEVGAGTGSGVIYKKVGNKAFVVTNNHVIQGAQRIEVTLNDGTKVPAEVLGADVFTDLAVLEIDAEAVTTVATLGSSDHLRLGEPVIAIGNPLGPEFSGSVTQGIISGLERTIPVDLDQNGTTDWEAEVIQTDAAINPGNSGGALVNSKGEVIGINSMKIARNAVEGIGLSIPISSAKPIIDDLELYSKVQRPFMGVELRSIAEIPGYHLEETLHLPKEVNQGIAILNVVPNSPADQAGLEQLDVIIALDDKPVKDDIALRKYLYRDKQIGEQMKITYYRNGVEQSTNLTLQIENIN